MITMHPHDLETLERVSGDAETRELFLRIARIERSGGMARFLVELSCDEDLDPATKEVFAEVACDRDFLYALDDYVFRTSRAH